MTKLQDARQKKEIKLPSGGTVTVWDGMLASGIDLINRRQNKEGWVGVSFILSLMIVDWDFTDDKEKKLLINEENIGRMNVKDVMVITKEIGIDQDFLVKNPA